MCQNQDWSPNIPLKMAPSKEPANRQVNNVAADHGRGRDKKRHGRGIQRENISRSLKVRGSTSTAIAEAISYLMRSKY